MLGVESTENFKILYKLIIFFSVSGGKLDC